MPSSIADVIAVLRRIQDLVVQGHVAIVGSVAFMLMMALTDASANPENFALMSMLLSKDGTSKKLEDIDLVFRTTDTIAFGNLMTCLKPKFAESWVDVTDRDDRNVKRAMTYTFWKDDGTRLNYVPEESEHLIAHFHKMVPETTPVHVVVSSKMIFISKLKLVNGVSVDIRLDPDFKDSPSAKAMYDAKAFDHSTVTTDVYEKFAVWFVKWCVADHFDPMETSAYKPELIGKALDRIDATLRSTPDEDAVLAKLCEFLTKYRLRMSKLQHFTMEKSSRGVLKFIREACLF